MLTIGIAKMKEKHGNGLQMGLLIKNFIPTWDRKLRGYGGEWKGRRQKDKQGKGTMSQKGN